MFTSFSRPLLSVLLLAFVSAMGCGDVAPAAPDASIGGAGSGGGAGSDGAAGSGGAPGGMGMDGSGSLPAGKAIASPNWCTSVFGDPYFNVVFISPPLDIGPFALVKGDPNTTATLFCPIHLAIPPGSDAVTITGMTMAFFDDSSHCRVEGDLRFKKFGTTGGGTLVTTVHSGGGPTDFAAAPQSSTTPVTDLALNITADQDVWVNAIVARDATGGGNCGYGGALISYTVIRP